MKTCVCKNPNCKRDGGEWYTILDVCPSFCPTCAETLREALKETRRSEQSE